MKLFFTQDYAANMNSIPERMNRTIIEHASALMWAVKLPIVFWWCAIAVTVYVKNHSPTKVLDITPYEAWTGEKPYLGHLQIFGCRATAHMPDELRKKSEWMSKSTDCIFIGYSETKNLFELLDINAGTIIHKRDVIFFEDQLGHPRLSDHALPEGTIVEEYAVNQIPQDVMLRKINMPLQPLPAQQSIDKLQEAKQTDELVIKQWNPSTISRQSTRILKKPRLALLAKQL